MKKYMLAAVAALALGGSAHAGDGHTVDDISRNGVIALDNGDTYRAQDDVSNWDVGDHVIVTDDGDKIINTTRDNEEANVEAN